MLLSGTFTSLDRAKWKRLTGHRHVEQTRSPRTNRKLDLGGTPWFRVFRFVHNACLIICTGHALSLASQAQSGEQSILTLAKRRLSNFRMSNTNAQPTAMKDTSTHLYKEA